MAGQSSVGVPHTPCPLSDEHPAAVAEAGRTPLAEQRAGAEGTEAEASLSPPADIPLGLTPRWGGCHCRAVRFCVWTPPRVTVLHCNCSICRMRGNAHFIVPAAHLALQPGSEAQLQLYQFGTRAARHLFCRRCGVCSFYVPRSDPAGKAVTLGCLDEEARGQGQGEGEGEGEGQREEAGAAPLEVQHVQFDGKHWEEAFAALGLVGAAERSGDGSSADAAASGAEELQRRRR